MKNQVFYTLFALLLLMGCKDESCMINEAYVYPIEAANGKSFEERIQMLKIPEQILHNLSTKALLKTCLDYPEIGLIWTMSDLQGGFDKVEAMCNGYEEFWKRGDKFQELIYLYKQKDFNRDWKSYTDLENGSYMMDIICVELVISQYEILHDLTVSEKTELFQLALDNQKVKYAQRQYWGIGMTTTCAILSRIMYLDKYQPLIEEYNKKENIFILVNLILTNSDTVDTVMSLSEEYLKVLKSK
jgi:hypothetical protein